MIVGDIVTSGAMVSRGLLCHIWRPIIIRKDSFISCPFFYGIMIRCFIVFFHSCIIGNYCIAGGVGDQAWDLEVLCYMDVGCVHYCRWSIIRGDRIGVICVMVLLYYF